MNSNRYTEGHRSVKIAFVLWELCLIALVLVEKYKVPHIFDPISLTESPQNSFWYLLSIAGTFVLLWVGGGYLFYLGFISIRHGELPPDTAIYPVRTKQRRGFLAYIGGVFLLLSATGFFFAPIMLNIMSNREIDRSLAIHKKLIEEGVLPPDR